MAVEEEPQSILTGALLGAPGIHHLDHLGGLLDLEVQSAAALGLNLDLDLVGVGDWGGRVARASVGHGTGTTVVVVDRGLGAGAGAVGHVACGMCCLVDRGGRGSHVCQIPRSGTT